MVSLIVALAFTLLTTSPTPPPNLPQQMDVRLTAYCPCPICCGEYALNRPGGVVYGAAGIELKTNYSIAATSDIPLGSLVLRNNQIYRVEDRVAEWVLRDHGTTIDFYFTDHQEAKDFGRHFETLVMIVETP